MNHIEKLLATLAPEGVKLRTLGEMGEFIRGNGLQKSDLTNEGAPAIHYGQIHTSYGVWADSTKSFVAVQLAAKLRRAQPGDLVVVTTSEDDAAVAKATAWIGDTEVAVSGDAYIFRHSLDPRYVSYFFQSEHFQSQKKRYVSGTKVRRISGNSLSKILIPVPPLEVQREIVLVLDRLAGLEVALSAELGAELEARRQQYDHYRDELFEFSLDRVDWVTMGSAGSFFGGLTGKTKADFTDGNARFISYVNIFSNSATVLDRSDRVRVDPSEYQRKINRSDALFTGSSETPDAVGMSSVVTQTPVEPTYLNSFSIGYRLHDPYLLDPHFAKHLYRSSVMRQQIMKTANGVTRFNISKARFAKVKIPIPVMEEQLRIAQRLDSLEVLVNDLTQALPAEIAGRRKQYEYYRDRLLTFEEVPG